MKISYGFILTSTWIWTISSSSSIQKSTTMTCSYESYNFKEAEEIIAGFKCTVVKKFEVKERGTVINKINRDDPEGYPQPKNYEDPSTLEISGKLVLYIPKGLDKYFGNLQILSIIGCELKELKQEDMKAFPNLRLLDLGQNVIETLEKDLFKFNPNLQSILFSLNNIQHIHPNIFDHLYKLNLLGFGGNNCINLGAQSRSEVLDKIVNGIKSQCQKFGEMETTKDLKKTGTQSGKYFWIYVGSGVVVGIFVVVAVARIVYGILRKV